MNTHDFTLANARLTALPSGALWWDAHRLLCVSDLHLGKSERVARRGGAMLPPYETADTLARLAAIVTATKPACVICLGDSFDDLSAAEALEDGAVAEIASLQAGRRWVWIEGNHDPGPVALGGEHLELMRLGPLTFRHIAEADAQGEISGHYHPKATLHARGKSLTAPAFLYDKRRLLMPAFGTYTGGLRATSAVLQRLMSPDACAVLTGQRTLTIPMPRVTAG